MSKRKYESEFMESNSRRVQSKRDQVKKHTLDSDEEDDVDEDDVLDAEDIEGEEDGIARQDDGQRMTAFNMKEEMEEGHFDKQGHFIWNNEKEVRDNWLDNIDWQKIKNASGTEKKYNIDEEQGLGAESDSESETENDFNEISTYKQIIEFMKPKETINKSLKRLGGDLQLSSVERLKRKKAGTLNNSEDVTNLTELANKILTNTGNMDVYQETFEHIKGKIDKHDKKTKVIEPELDMYADDFDSKEKEKLQTSSTSDDTDKHENNETERSEEQKQLMWEFKWKIEDDEIQGPYTTSQMVKWAQEKYFKTGVMVRKCGENSNFYSSTRIDFELYE